MAKVRISVPKSSTWLPQLGGWTNLGGLNHLMANITPSSGNATPTVTETTGTSDPKKKEYASARLVFFSYLLIIAGAWLGNLLAASAKSVSFLPAKDALDTIGFLALFFIMAQAIERFMEPIAELDFSKIGIEIGSARKNKDNELQAKIKAAEDSTNSADRQANANAAADSQADANHIAANTKVFIWGLASFIAMLASGATKVFFLDAIGFKGVPDYLNVLITGLVIGGGTKPLHDLIKLIEKKSSDTSTEENAGEESGS